MKPNFLAMTKSELKRYLLENRNDNEAFEALMDKINAEPNPRFYTVDEIGGSRRFGRSKTTFGKWQCVSNRDYD